MNLISGSLFIRLQINNPQIDSFCWKTTENRWDWLLHSYYYASVRTKWSVSTWSTDFQTSLGPGLGTHQNYSTLVQIWPETFPLIQTQNIISAEPNSQPCISLLSAAFRFLTFSFFTLHLHGQTSIRPVNSVTVLIHCFLAAASHCHHQFTSLMLFSF